MTRSDFGADGRQLEYVPGRNLSERSTSVWVSTLHPARARVDGGRNGGRADRVGIMPATSVLLNLLWIIFGGVEMAAGWLLAAVIMAITIIGLPWARAALTIAIYTLLPFGHTVIDRPSGAIGGTLGFIGNLIWLLLAGWWLALGHLIMAVALAVTIIGIPFAWAHLKLAGISLWPVGKDITSIEESRRVSPW
jgi:uncharacterized membrane protein YccF (DUF307 family)